MAATTFKQFKAQHEEQVLVESLVQNGLVEDILTEEDWSDEMTAGELLEELGFGSNI